MRWLAARAVIKWRLLLTVRMGSILAQRAQKSVRPDIDSNRPVYHGTGAPSQNDARAVTFHSGGLARIERHGRTVLKFNKKRPLLKTSSQVHSPHILQYLGWGDFVLNSTSIQGGTDELDNQLFFSHQLECSRLLTTGQAGLPLGQFDESENETYAAQFNWH